MSTSSPTHLVQGTVEFLRGKNRVLFLTTSNRWSGEEGGELPKSTRLAYRIQELVGEDVVEVMEVPKLRVYPCEGNVSTARGNTCGVREAVLADSEKNPSGDHRCWASLNNQDDELWKVSKALLEADGVVFFGSVRWGQMNACYQTLIERLTWLENRHSTLGEDNILGNIDGGIIIINQNWKGEEVLTTQREVLEFFGFTTPPELSWYWQYTTDTQDEDPETYRDAAVAFEQLFLSKE